jgi:quercetin dioxygenase-like cupin family protein
VAPPIAWMAPSTSIHLAPRGIGQDHAARGRVDRASTGAVIAVSLCAADTGATAVAAPRGRSSDPSSRQAMKKWGFISAMLLVAAVVTTASLAQSNGPKAASHRAAVVLPAGDLEWKPMANVPNVQVAVVYGSMSKGAYGAFVKLPANDIHPLHTHSSAVKLVVISGEFKYAPENGDEKVLGPGSYLDVPGGLRHTSATGDGETLIYQEQSGSWDLKPVTPAAGK